MRTLKLIVGLSLLIAATGCTAYYSSDDPYYYSRPHYYHYYSY